VATRHSREHSHSRFTRARQERVPTKANLSRNGLIARARIALTRRFATRFDKRSGNIFYDWIPVHVDSLAFHFRLRFFIFLLLFSYTIAVLISRFLVVHVARAREYTLRHLVLSAIECIPRRVSCSRVGSGASYRATSKLGATIITRAGYQSARFITIVIQINTVTLYCFQ